MKKNDKINSLTFLGILIMWSTLGILSVLAVSDELANSALMGEPEQLERLEQANREDPLFNRHWHNYGIVFITIKPISTLFIIIIFVSSILIILEGVKRQEKE